MGSNPAASFEQLQSLLVPRALQGVVPTATRFPYNPLPGLSVQRTDAGAPSGPGFYIWNGTAWIFVGPSSGGGVGFGTSFPGSPSTGQEFFRTDLLTDFFWNGSAWVQITVPSLLGSSGAQFTGKVQFGTFTGTGATVTVTMTPGFTGQNTYICLCKLTNAASTVQSVTQISGTQFSLATINADSYVWVAFGT